MLRGICEDTRKERIRDEHIKGNLWITPVEESKGMAFEMVWAGIKKSKNSPFSMYSRNQKREDL